jgi:hypothetical protein
MTHKERFCAAWTSSITHYGNATTSRVEGMHRAVKAELPNRQGHLRTVIRAFQAYNERLNEQIEDRLANERIRIDLKPRSDEVFHGLHTQISSFALKKVLACRVIQKEVSAVAPIALQVNGAFPVLMYILLERLLVSLYNLKSFMLNGASSP